MSFIGLPNPNAAQARNTLIVGNSSMTLASLSDTNASIEELRSKLASTHDVTTLRTTIPELRQTVLTNSSHRESAMKRLASIEHSLDTLSAGAKKTNTMGGLVDSDNTQEAPTMPGQTPASENATGGAAGAGQQQDVVGMVIASLTQLLDSLKA